MTGPGKYDDLCTFVREESKAGAAVVIILGGTHGPGFSAQFTNESDLMALPGALRSVAAQIEADRVKTASK